MIVSATQIREALGSYEFRSIVDGSRMAQAAVAMVLREAADGAEVLMIRRAERPGDPWSGHMGFPGGRVEPGDATPEAAAIRETDEEVGLDLQSCADRLGRLSEIQARSAVGVLPLAIMPFVFSLTRPVELRTSEEVAELMWIPVRFFCDRANRATMRQPTVGAVRTLPCYHYAGRVIWGMSLAMLDELLFRVLGM